MAVLREKCYFSELLPILTDDNDHMVRTAVKCRRIPTLRLASFDIPPDAFPRKTMHLAGFVPGLSFSMVTPHGGPALRRLSGND